MAPIARKAVAAIAQRRPGMRGDDGWRCFGRTRVGVDRSSRRRRRDDAAGAPPACRRVRHSDRRRPTADRQGARHCPAGGARAAPAAPKMRRHRRAGCIGGAHRARARDCIGGPFPRQRQEVRHRPPQHLRTWPPTCRRVHPGVRPQLRSAVTPRSPPPGSASPMAASLAQPCAAGTRLAHRPSSDRARRRIDGADRGAGRDAFLQGRGVAPARSRTRC